MDSTGWVKFQSRLLAHFTTASDSRKVLAGIVASLLALSIISFGARQTNAASTAVATFQVVVRAGLLNDNSPIKGARVTVEGIPGILVTDDQGKTPIINVPTGVLTIHVDASGWQPLDMGGIVVPAQSYYWADAYLVHGTGRRQWNNNPPHRQGSQTTSQHQPAGGVQPNDVGGSNALPVVAPTQIRNCDANGANCVYTETETFVQYALWHEWGDATPNYNSSNWPLSSLEAGAVAIRSWLYYNANPNMPSCKHQADCSVWQYEGDLVWQTNPPGQVANYSSAMQMTPKFYAYYGTYVDRSGNVRRKPIDAMFADRTGNPSKDGSINKDGTSNGKVYLQSHASEPDLYVENYRSAYYAPGVSQKGSADWIRGFVGNGTFYQLADNYQAILSHDYDYSISYDTAN